MEIGCDPISMREGFVSLALAGILSLTSLGCAARQRSKELVALEKLESDPTLTDTDRDGRADKRVDLEPDFSPEQAAEIANSLITSSCDELGISEDTILGVGVALAPHALQ